MVDELKFQIEYPKIRLDSYENSKRAIYLLLCLIYNFPDNVYTKFSNDIGLARSTIAKAFSSEERGISTSIFESFLERIIDFQKYTEKIYLTEDDMILILLHLDFKQQKIQKNLKDKINTLYASVPSNIPLYYEVNDLSFRLNSALPGKIFLDDRLFSDEDRHWVEKNVREKMLVADISNWQYLIHSDQNTQKFAAALAFMPHKIIGGYTFREIAKRMPYLQNDTLEQLLGDFIEKNFIIKDYFMGKTQYKVHASVSRIINSIYPSEVIEIEFSKAKKGPKKILANFTTPSLRKYFSKSLFNPLSINRRKEIFSKKENFSFEDIVSIEKILAGEIQFILPFSRFFLFMIFIITLFTIGVTTIWVTAISGEKPIGLVKNLLELYLLNLVYIGIIFVSCSQYDLGWKNVFEKLQK